MELPLGLLFASLSLIGWGVGDFLSQQGTRRVGVQETLLAIRLFAVCALFPLVVHELPSLTLRDGITLAILAIPAHIFAVVIFTALKYGKISIVESVVALELPLTVALSVFVGGELLSIQSLALFMVVMIGILLAVTQKFDALRDSRFEKGVRLALIAAVLSAIVNFSIGMAAKEFSPLLTVWVLDLALLIMSITTLGITGRLVPFVRDFPQHVRLYAGAGFFDVLGWAGYASAAPLISIALTATITESYIALAALLGVFVNRERLRPHQFLGATLAIGGVIAFAHISLL